MFEPNDYPHKAQPRPRHRHKRDDERLYAQDMLSRNHFDNFDRDMRLHLPSPAVGTAEDQTETASTLRSRASTLTRRCSAMKAAIRHLGAAVEPLSTTKRADFDDRCMGDVQHEAQLVHRAYQELMSQINDVLWELKGVERKKAKKREEAAWAEREGSVKWRYGERRQGRERGGMVWFS